MADGPFINRGTQTIRNVVSELTTDQIRSRRDLLSLTWLNRENRLLILSMLTSDIMLIEPSYHEIRSFPLPNRRWLFFDMFCRNGEVILIMPGYGIGSPDLDALVVKYGDSSLKLKNSFVHLEYEPIVVLIYTLPATCDSKSIEVDVIYRQ